MSLSSPETPLSTQVSGAHLLPGEPKKRKRGATRLSCAECRRCAPPVRPPLCSTHPHLLDSSFGVTAQFPAAPASREGVQQYVLTVRIPSVPPSQPLSDPVSRTGSLQTGKGNRYPSLSLLYSYLRHSYLTSATRFVLASTQDLHDKINELANRVRELEDGLRTSHSQHSQEQHPLLSEDLLRIKAPLQREGLGASSSSASGDLEGDVVESFGTLAISDTGRTSYFGQATGSFVCQPRSIGFPLFSPCLPHLVLAPGSHSPSSASR